MEVLYKGVVIRIVKGDITELNVDAIVNAANNHLWMGSGVAGAIKKKGGEDIEREAMSKGPIDVGKAVVTGAGRLKAKYVVHAAVMGQDLKTDENKIYSATYASLVEANGLKITSIAFPALGTGVGGFPFREAAFVMFKAIKDFLDKTDRTTIKEIILCLFQEEAYNEFKAVLGEVFG